MTIMPEWIHRVRLVLETVIGLLLVIVDELPNHVDHEGAGIGLGALLLVAGEVTLRWMFTTQQRPPAS